MEVTGEYKYKGFLSNQLSVVYFKESMSKIISLTLPKNLVSILQ